MKIELKNITKSFEIDKKSKKQKEILKDISCVFEGSKLYFLTGVSGSGKSTLLSILGLLDSPTSGEILFDDQIIKNKTNFISSKISFVFQEYNLFENLTVYENLSLYQKDKEVLKKLLEQFNCEISLNTKVKYLSGGERQRLAILRSYIKGGEVFLMDEPTGNLDKDNSKMVMELIKSISKEKLVIVVSHDLELAYEYADEIYDIDDGKLTKKEQVGISYTLNLKEEGKSAFNPLIEKLFSLGELHLIIDGKEVTWTKSNYLNEIARLADENNNKKLLIRIKKPDLEMKQFSQIKPQLNNSSFFSHYCLRNIASKAGRTIFSFIAIALSFALLFTAFNFIFYDVGYHINTNLEANNVYVSSVAGRQQNGSNLYVGADLYHVFESQNNYFSQVSNNILQDPNTSRTLSYHLLAVKEDTITFQGQTYNMPNSEILAFDTVYAFAHNNVKTDYLEIRDFNGQEVRVKLSSNYIRTSNISSYEDTFNNLAFISADYYSSLVDKNLSFEVAAPQKIGDNVSNLDTQTYLEYNNQNLIAGESIRNDNEIVVSTSFIEKFVKEIDLSNVVGKTYEINDFSTFPENVRKSQNSIYDLSEFWEEVTIVGVTDDITSDIYVSNNIYNRLSQQRYYNCRIFVFTENCANMINYLYANDVYLETMYARDIYNFASIFLGDTILLFVTASIIILVIASIILLLWIITILKDRYREIAIMKCMGLKNKHVYSTFLAMILLVTSISILVGVIIGLGLHPALNAFIINSLVANPTGVSLYSMNIYSFLLPFLFLIVYPPLVSLMFIRKIDKIEPYSALKEFK